MLEAWSSAPLRAKCLNLASLFLTFLAFISCCVSFGAELFVAQSTDLSQAGQLVTFHFYHDRIESELGHSYFADMNLYHGYNRCTDGGRTLVAFAALAFLTLLATLTLATSRILSLPIVQLPLPGRSLRVELVLSAVSAPLLLLSVALYGSWCYQSFQGSVYFENVRATGYVFSIVGVLVQVLQLGVCWLLKADERCWLGIAEGSAYWTSKARGEGDGYQEEKLSGFEEGDGASDVDEEEADKKEDEEDERRRKRSRSKSHRHKGKHRSKPVKVKVKMFAMKPIDPAYDYGRTYQTSIDE